MCRKERGLVAEVGQTGGVVRRVPGEMFARAVTQRSVVRGRTGGKRKSRHVL